MIGYGKIAISLSLMMSICGITIWTVLKKAASRNIQEEMDGDDMISQLPDDILVTILARLPTEDLARTGSLSKRWRYLYKRVRHIKFGCRDLLSFQDYHYHGLDNHRHRCLVLVLDRLGELLRRRQGYIIRSLQLDCCITDRSRLRACCDRLQHSGVEALDLGFSCRKKQSHELCFPLDHLHLLPSLNLLRLSFCVLQPEFAFKSYSLQTLQLKYVKVFPAALGCILSGCLRLRSLSIQDCECPTKISISGPDLPLKSLTLQYCGGVEEVELHASNLTVMDFRNREMINFIFDHVPQLRTLYFSVQGKNSQPRRVSGAPNSYFPSLKRLVLVATGSFYEDSSKLMKLGVGRFSELRELRLYLCCMPKMNPVALMIPILQSCSLLEEFHLDMQNIDYEEGGGPEMRMFGHLSLKQVELSGVSGKDKEIGFALCILRGAERLDEMRILWSPNYYKRCCGWRMQSRNKREWDEESIRQKLQGGAISKNARLIIQHIHAHTSSSPIIRRHNTFTIQRLPIWRPRSTGIRELLI